MTAEPPAIVRAQRLTRTAFAPFGDVIETEGAEQRLINGGTTTRFHDLARVDVAVEDGRPLISIFRGQPFALPVEIRMMERHPFGSQAFVPLQKTPFLVVVAPDEDGRPGTPLAFLVDDGRGVNYARNVWHHPLLSLERVGDFLVVDRGGAQSNLEEANYPRPYAVIGA
ncbi:ureidoglycolate lyase [Aurantimonas sp. HBX-1]|uniref:ureidoglycolate lyase n=1 Tax=Aurantimonas sp. HBX-1 TaxID=2906072 RepID=UPI001F17FD8E|nr:ureidoglycolate lyase [Aurantimonas sp. HBX-1]UIJ72307.1 ureidoglycolate lyase [Aurantimonas sp. HBX-1]